LTLALGTSIAGLALGLYNSEEWECWIAAYPEDCHESWSHDGVTTCLRGDNASLYRWGFYYAFLWLAILFVSINMFRVYRCVFEQEKKMNKYNFEYQRELEKLEKQRLQAELQELYDQQDDEDDDNDSVDSAASHASARSVISVASSIAGSAFRSASFVARISYQSIKSIPKMQRKRDALKRHFKHSRQVATQGYWFLGAFLATWIFPTVARIVHLVTKQTFYPLILLTALFVPIQGFFNFLVYIQSHKKKRQQIQDSVCCCGWMKLPKRKQRKRPSTSSSTSHPGVAEKDVLPINAKDVSSSHSSDIDFHEQSGSFKASSEIMRLSDVTSPEAAKAAAAVRASTADVPEDEDAENDLDATDRHVNNMHSSDRQQESTELQLTSAHLRELEKFDTHVGTSGEDDSHSDLTVSNASAGDIHARNTNEDTESNDELANSGGDVTTEGGEEGEDVPRAMRRPRSNNDLRLHDLKQSMISMRDLRASKRRDGSDVGDKHAIPLSIPLELEFVAIPDSSTNGPMVDQSEITLGEDSSGGNGDQRRRGRSDRGAFHLSLIPNMTEEAGESDMSDSSEVNEQSASHHRVKRRGRRNRGDKNKDKKPSPLEALYRRTKTS